jgi:hypothetical protein
MIYQLTKSATTFVLKTRQKKLKLYDQNIYDQETIHSCDFVATIELLSLWNVNWNFRVK